MPAINATAASKPFHAMVRYSRRRPRATRAARSEVATGGTGVEAECIIAIIERLNFEL
jgi:hypothetical protein